ncbi:MAG: hypothetical protein ACOVMT_04195 [Caulobacter sp.]
MALAPLTVFDGYVIADHVWERTEDGWECDYETIDTTRYPTPEACQQAIDEGKYNDNRE